MSSIVRKGASLVVIIILFSSVVYSSDAHVVSEIPNDLIGTGDPLSGVIYGGNYTQESDVFLEYLPGSQQSENITVSIPLLEDWESSKISAEVSEITEAKQWISETDFSGEGAWTLETIDVPSEYGSYENSLTTNIESGHAFFEQQGYWYDDRPTTQLYGYWYDVGDKCYVAQNINFGEHETLSASLSLDYYADCFGWTGFMTGFFELFISMGDPDNGGQYIWSLIFDAIADDNTWYSTGNLELDPNLFNQESSEIWVGLRTTSTDWYRADDIIPRAQFDNIILQLTTKASPESVDLRLNGELFNSDETDVGDGYAEFTSSTPMVERVNATITWNPAPLGVYDDLAANITFDLRVRPHANSDVYWTTTENVSSPTGEKYEAINGSAVSWECNFFVDVPDVYRNLSYFVLTIPYNRDVHYIACPLDRNLNVTDWSLGEYNDGYVNVSLSHLTSEDSRGFWLIRSTSQNMISDLQVYVSALEDIIFRAHVPAIFQTDIVSFTVYTPFDELYNKSEVSIDEFGFAHSPALIIGDEVIPEGVWTVLATVNDSISTSEFHSIGIFLRSFQYSYTSENSTTTTTTTTNSTTSTTSNTSTTTTEITTPTMTTTVLPPPPDVQGPLILVQIILVAVGAICLVIVFLRDE